MRDAAGPQSQKGPGAPNAQPSPPLFAPLRHPLFRRMWFANAVGNLGNLVQMVGASWLMTTIAPSAEMVALVVSANTLPILILALLSGALADVFDRRLVMLTAQSMMLAAAVVLAVLTYMGLTTPWLLLGLTFVLGCGAAINNPSWQASVAEQVPREDLPGAIALNTLGFNFARCAGPAIGGLVVTFAGSSSAFLLNALSYVGFLIVLGRWRPAKPEAMLPPETLTAAMRAGPQYVFLSPLRAVLLRALMIGLTGSAIWALMPLVARDALGAGAGAYGLLLGSFGLGAVLGALVSAKVRAWLTTEVAVAAGSVLFGLAVLCVAASHWLLLSLSALFIGGAAWVICLSTLSITVQMTTPRWVVGRVLSLFQMATYGGMALGSWAWGSVAAVSSVRMALAISAGCVLASVLLALRWRLPESDDIDLEPIRFATHQKLPIRRETDPVTVSVTYRVAPKDAAAFARAMIDKRRIRLRDGVRRWVLMQDIADAEVWVEQFQCRSWVEYLRQRGRPTHDDLAIEERILAFHRADHPPRVQRLLDRTGALARENLPVDEVPFA